MNNILLFCADNAEWVVPLILLILGEILLRFVPTKDPDGLTERIGKIIVKFLDGVRLKNARIDFKDKSNGKGQDKK